MKAFPGIKSFGIDTSCQQVCSVVVSYLTLRQLENKAFKENLHTKEPTIEDWSLVCSNTNVLKTMKEMQLHDYQVGKASSGAWAPDYAARIEFCRSKIREMKHLKFDNNCHLVNARGDRLSSDCVRLMETC